MEDEGKIVEFDGDNGEHMEVKIRAECLGMTRTLIFEVC